MIILDTNIVSEVMKAEPNPAVLAWMNAQDGADLFLTVITIGEISFGLHGMTEGRRRQSLDSAFERIVESDFQDRVLPVTAESARRYGVLMAQRKALGRPLGVADGFIAAIAFVEGFALATRNVRDFDHCGVTVINPFEPGHLGLQEDPL